MSEDQQSPSHSQGSDPESDQRQALDDPGTERTPTTQAADDSRPLKGAPMHKPMVVHSMLMSLPVLIVTACVFGCLTRGFTSRVRGHAEWLLYAEVFVCGPLMIACFARSLPPERRGDFSAQGILIGGLALSMPLVVIDC